MQKRLQGGVCCEERRKGPEGWWGPGGWVIGEAGPGVRGLGVNSGLWQETEFIPDGSNEKAAVPCGQH